MMALNASDATERVEQLCLLTERLTELIAFEAQAFEQHRPQDAIEQLAETSQLANVYRHESYAFAPIPDWWLRHRWPCAPA